LVGIVGPIFHAQLGLQPGPNWLISENFWRKHATLLDDWSSGFPVYCRFKSQFGFRDMYQLQVKRWLIALRFHPRDGWKVTVDIDAMERGNGGQHPPEKKAIAAECEAWLREQGVKIVAHPLYGRADLVAEHDQHGTYVIEVEGKSSRQREQAMYSAVGQIVLSMGSPAPAIRYAVAVPDDDRWEKQLKKIPARVLSLLNLELFLVSESSVRSIGAEQAVQPERREDAAPG